MKIPIPVIAALVGIAFCVGYTVGKNEMTETAWRCTEIYRRAFADAYEEIVTEECVCSWDED